MSSANGPVCEAADDAFLPTGVDPGPCSPDCPVRGQVARAVAAIEAEGYTVEFKEFCEDSETPGLLGMIAGVTVHHRQVVKCSTHDRPAAQIAAILRHELEHVLGAVRGSDNPEHGLACGGSGSPLSLLDGTR